MKKFTAFLLTAIASAGIMAQKAEAETYVLKEYDCGVNIVITTTMAETIVASKNEDNVVILMFEDTDENYTAWLTVTDEYCGSVHFVDTNFGGSE